MSIWLLLSGCGVAPSPSSETPTWHQDVHPIVAQRCGDCHSDGTIAWSMDEYAVVQALAPQMLDAVEGGRMPPWFAERTDECAPVHDYYGDPRLTQAELAVFREWVDGGAPEGDPDDPAWVPTAVDVGLTGASKRLEPEQGWVASGDADQFRCFSFDLGLTEEAWLTGSQANPDQASVVHHALLFIDPAGDSAPLVDESGSYECFGGPGIEEAELAGAWAPGSAPFQTPTGSAMRLPAGARLVAQVHYHPLGGESEVDRTSYDLRWSTEPPEWETGLYLVGNFGESLGERGGLAEGPNDRAGAEFRIPAGAVGHTETMSYTVDAEEVGPAGVKIWMAGNHMHYVGTDMIWKILHDEPREGEPGEECMVHTPRWDFDWQSGYAFDTPLSAAPQLRPGDTIWMRCTYDNSVDNPAVMRALAEQGLAEPVAVRLGEETLDEMCLAVFGAAWPRL